MKKNVLLFFFLAFSVAIMAQDTSFFKSQDDEKLFYTSFGTGSKVVILYGGPGYGSDIIFSWHKLLKKNQCIFYDQRGTGLSKNAKVDTSTINLRVAVNDIEELRIHLKEEKLVIIGFSWGAGLAMSYASKYPENVSNLILVSPIGPDFSYVYEQYYNILSRRSVQETDSLNYWSKPEVIAADSAMALKMKTFYTYIPYFFDHLKGRPMMWKLINEADFNPKMFKLMMNDLKANAYDVKDGLLNYKGQCTIIRGQQDVISYKVVVQIQKFIPQTIVNEIQGCGHFVDLESPFPFQNNLKKALKES
jgi:proline iminopeptidase